MIDSMLISNVTSHLYIFKYNFCHLVNRFAYLTSITRFTTCKSEGATSMQSQLIGVSLSIGITSKIVQFLSQPDIAN